MKSNTNYIHNNVQELLIQKVIIIPSKNNNQKKFQDRFMLPLLIISKILKVKINFFELFIFDIL